MNNFIGKVLYKVKNRNDVDPYQKVCELERNTNEISGKNLNRALVVPYRMSSASNLFEGNLSLVLKARGYDVDTLLCGGEHYYCDTIDAYHVKLPRCKVCTYEQSTYLKSYGLKGYTINDLLEVKSKLLISKYIDGLDLNLENLSKCIFRGVHISRPLFSAIQLYKKSASLDFEKDREIIVGYIETICKTILALENYFLKNSVNFVVVSHGVYSTWGTIQQFCLAKKIHFVTWGREYHGAGVIASHNDSYLNEPMYEKNSPWDIELNEVQRTKAISYLKGKVGFEDNKSDYVNYHNQTKRILPKTVVREKLHLGESAIVVGLFPNIPWDGQTFRPAKLFETIETWVFESIRFFQDKKDVFLVIRSHPAELHADGGVGETMKDMIMNKFGDKLPSNVIILPGDSDISSLSIASISNACLLYGSTIGYETMFLRKPTILASDFFYSNKNISHDPTSKKEYFEMLKEAIDGSLEFEDERYERLLQYTYHYQFRRIMPETVMNLDGLTFSSFKYETLSDLVKDAPINKFIDCCENKTNFYFDEFH